MQRVSHYRGVLLRLGGCRLGGHSPGAYAARPPQECPGAGTPPYQPSLPTVYKQVMACDKHLQHLGSITIYRQRLCNLSGRNAGKHAHDMRMTWLGL